MRKGRQRAVAVAAQTGGVERLRHGTGPARPAEHPVLETDRGEALGVTQQHLGVPEKQHPLGGEREVEPVEHISLCLGVEIHQRVAAQQQIDTRYGCILDEVVAPEDHRPAQVLVQRVASAHQIEMPAQHVLGHRLHRFGAVGGGPRLVERILVDVGGIDLHPPPEGVGRQDVGQHHRQRIGLLTGGAACTPNPERLIGTALGQQRRQHVGAQEFPRIGVAEEGRHVDEDGVEQCGELVGAGLQGVQIFVEGLGSDLIHAVADPAHQGGALVAGEVEAAGVPQIVQHRLE